VSEWLGAIVSAIAECVASVYIFCPSGDVPEWLWSGLQNRLPRFNSGRRLQRFDLEIISTEPVPHCAYFPPLRTSPHWMIHPRPGTVASGRPNASFALD
jgi:hypothetical protein